ncbi:MAG: SDR family oxidoreductase [Thermomicrobiales bacterium]
MPEPVSPAAAPRIDPAWGKGFGRLAGKNALVTGSTRGLGRTMAEWLAREGANIVVSGRHADDVAASVAAVEAIGAQAWGIPADLANVDDAHRLGTEAIEAVGQLDILVNNAGMSIRGNFWEVTDAEWDEQVAINVRSPFILAQHAAAHMIERGTRGRIVNVSTIGVFAGHKDGMVYNIAKAGVQAMTRNMSYELAPYGISVNCVAPGAVPDKPGTPLREGIAPPRYIPFGRFGRAEDIAAAVVFFCLPETEWTTGQTLLIDGAHHSYLKE